MSRINLPFIILGFSGSFAIVGAGFSAWIFGNAFETPITAEASASVMVAEEARVGNFYMPNEKEAREQFIIKNKKLKRGTINGKPDTVYYTHAGQNYEYQHPLYNFSYDQYSALNATNRTDNTGKAYNFDKEFTTMSERYRYRSIVFGEGDIATGNDGLEFHRFQATTLTGVNGEVSEIQTFVPENVVHGQFMVDAIEYEKYQKAGYEIQAGVNVTFPTRAAGDTYAGDILSDYIDLAPDYASNPATFDVTNNLTTTKYISLNDPLNKTLFKWKEATYLYEPGQIGIKGVCGDTLKGDTKVTTFKVFDFVLDLQGMFSYKTKELIPDDLASIKKIYNAIDAAKKANRVDLWTAHLALFTSYKTV